MPVSADTSVVPTCKNPARWRIFVRLTAKGVYRAIEADTLVFLCDGHKGEQVTIEDSAWEKFEAIFVSKTRAVPTNRFVDVVPFLNLGTLEL
jgi:hypothetical protein